LKYIFDIKERICQYAKGPIFGMKFFLKKVQLKLYFTEKVV